MNGDDIKHHVAWADRLGLNKQWGRDVDECSSAFGRDYYDDMVERFLNNIINIHNGPALRSIINEYIEKDLMMFKEKSYDNWVEKNPRDVQDDDLIIKEIKRIEILAYRKLYNFILQTLEDNNFIFYQSSYEEEDKML